MEEQAGEGLGDDLEIFSEALFEILYSEMNRSNGSQLGF